MRYYITRTSVSDDEKPCDGVESVLVPIWDQRAFKSAEEHDAKLRSESWLSRGAEHGVNEVGIYRRLTTSLQQKWVIETDSIEDLVKRYGRIIVDEVSELDRRSSDGIQFELEIYDSYRE